MSSVNPKFHEGWQTIPFTHKDIFFLYVSKRRVAQRDEYDRQRPWGDAKRWNLTHQVRKKSRPSDYKKKIAGRFFYDFFPFFYSHQLWSLTLVPLAPDAHIFLFHYLSRNIILIFYTVRVLLLCVDPVSGEERTEKKIWDSDCFFNFFFSSAFRFRMGSIWYPSNSLHIPFHHHDHFPWGTHNKDEKGWNV